MDALAVTLATDGKALGLAPLGTSLTDEQAAQVHSLGREPVVATDADPAGQVAAERDYWLLTRYRINPLHARLPDGSDPAEMIAAGTPDRLATAIEVARPLAHSLVDERLAGWQDADGALEALRVVAAEPPTDWADGIQQVASQSGLPTELLQAVLVSLVRAWNEDPRRASPQAATPGGHTNDRVTAARQEHETETLDYRPLASNRRPELNPGSRAPMKPNPIPR
ncbi:MAG: toprim domain-containing protein, partial [Propionicimonas sp.]|nr:toprim domain-containing protein [Propionicimonas sp.]